MGTKGKVKALTALGAARSRNKARILKGKKPIIGGKKVSGKTFKKVTGKSIGAEKKAAIKAAGSKKKAVSKASKQAALSRKKKVSAAKSAKKNPGAKVKPGAFAKRFKKANPAIKKKTSKRKAKR